MNILKRIDAHTSALDNMGYAIRLFAAADTAKAFIAAKDATAEYSTFCVIKGNNPYDSASGAIESELISCINEFHELARRDVGAEGAQSRSETA